MSRSIRTRSPFRLLALPALAIVLALFLHPIAALAAQAAEAADGSDARDIFFDDRVFKGEGSKQDAYFEIGNGYKLLPGSSIDLYVSHSETLLPDLSTLTVLVDDIPIGSLALTEANAKESLWRLDLTSLDLRPGFHKVTFWAKMKISTVVCVDPQNSSSWMVVHRRSKFNLKLGPGYSSPDLSWYPSPFVLNGSANPLRSILVVPDDVTEAEFAAAAALSRFLAGQAPNGRLDIPVYPESELTDEMAGGHSIIWLGETGRWKGKGKAVIDDFARRLTSGSVADGWIGETQSIWNQERTHLIVTGSGTQLMNAAEILSTESLYKQLQGFASPIPAALAHTDEAADSDTEESYTMTLEQLGYGNLVTEGVLQGGTTINYVIPSQWDLANGATLHLKYSHSASLLFDKSVMTVRLNGVPVQSVKLAQNTSGGGSLDVRLDPAVIGTSRVLSIDLGFQFVNPSANAAEAIATSACTDSLLGDWAVVDKTSSLSFSPVGRTTFNLDSLPYPFVSAGEWNKTTVVLTDRSSETLSSALTLIGAMGTGVTGRSDFRLADAADANLVQSLTDRNIICVGSTSGLPGFLNDFADSYIRFGASDLKSRSDKVELLSELQTRASVLQLTRSPLNPERTVLLLAATERDRLPSMRKALTEAEQAAQIRGRVIVVDRRDVVHVFPKTIDASRQAASDFIPASNPKRPLPYGKYAFAGGFALVLVAAVVLLVAIRRRGRP